MKKIIALLLSAVLLFCFAACGKQDTTKTTTSSATNKSTTQTTAKTTNKESSDSGVIPDSMTSKDGRYEIAFVADNGQMLDKSFNAGTWEGVKKYAYENDKSYKYYQPANNSQSTDTDRYNSLKTAAENGAKVIVCAGYLQQQAVEKAAADFPDVKFIFIDGQLSKQDEGENQNKLANIAAINYNEEQAGFLAGFAAVSEGYERLGFTGGGAGTNPSCNRFAYGFAQGAEMAAKELDKNVELTLSWEYGSTFSPSAELQTMLSGWYANGTEVIFCCGGSMCQSAFAAASANDGAVIGCDVDQSSQSDTVITSATKELTKVVYSALEKAYSDKWNEIGGKETTLGVKDDAVGLPTEGWKLKNFSKEDYNKLCTAMKDGEITVDRDYEKLTPESFERVSLVIV